MVASSGDPSYGVQRHKATGGVYVADAGSNNQEEWGVQRDWACGGPTERVVESYQLVDWGSGTIPCCT